jgi:hypothetical protein
MGQNLKQPGALRPLKRGDRVVVYQKPYTSEAKEGRAILQQKLESGSDRWLVQFPPDPPTEVYERIVLPEHREL